MITFQFHGDVDFFELDPVDYAPALGERGLARYRQELGRIEARPEPPGEGERKMLHRHDQIVLEWNAQRLAVLDRDIDAIIRPHARDMRVAAWLEDTAEALEEVGETDLAIDWAKRATEFDLGHQSLRASAYWCELLEEHRPDEAVLFTLTSGEATHDNAEAGGRDLGSREHRCVHRRAARGASPPATASNGVRSRRAPVN